MKDYAIICSTHVLWDHVWQRPQQLMSRLAKERGVLYYLPVSLKHLLRDPQIWWPKVKGVVQDGVFLMRPIVLSNPRKRRWLELLNQKLLAFQLKRFARKHGWKDYVLWALTPIADNVAGKLGEKAVVYDIMDEHAHMYLAEEGIEQKEQSLLKKSQVVFTGTESLYQSKKPYHSNISFEPCGVEFEHFDTRSKSFQRPSELEGLEGPICGYFGVFEKRMDFALMHQMAENFKHCHFVYIGPHWKPMWDEFAGIDNVHLLGKKPYAQLPNYVHFMSALLLPLEINDLTRHINPTKLLEYFAARKPVISSAIPDIVKLYPQEVSIADNRDQFCQMLQKALEKPDTAQLEKNLQIAQKRSWEQMARNMLSKVDVAVS